MHPTQAHSAKPKDLHFLRLKCVSAFWCHVQKLLCPSGCSTPCGVWINMEALPLKNQEKLQEKIDWTGFTREQILHDCSFSSQRVDDRFTDSHEIKKSLTFKTFINPMLFNWFLRKEFLSHKKWGFSFPGMRSTSSHLPKIRTKIYGRQSLFARAPAMGSSSNFLGGNKALLRGY